MTLIELFNGFHDATRRVNLTSDARSLFLAFMQHWNAQRRPLAVDISVAALRETAKLNEESYRRAAMTLSNLNFWKMKRKAHAKDGRLIRIGEFFLGENPDRRETVAEPVFSASPPAPPSDRGNPPQADFPPETKTVGHAPAQENSQSDFPASVEWFRGKTFADVQRNQKALNWLNFQANANDYEQAFIFMKLTEKKNPLSFLNNR